MLAIRLPVKTASETRLLVRDVSESWNVNLGYSNAGLAEITILNAKVKRY